VSRMIGAPPGYVGYEEGGRLTEQVRRRPYSVVLFDEIEKAHPDIFNVLLQILEDGRLTDGKGRTVDFRNAVLVMTSNVGSAALFELAVSDPERARQQALDALRAAFRPEFLNRVDDIIVFHQLLREEIFSIVDLMIAKVDERLKDRDMAIELRPAAKDLLSQRGYDPVLGARPLRRTIQREIEDSLSEKILFGELRPGQIVIVDVEGSGETAKFTFNGVAKPDVVDDVPTPEMTSEPVDIKGSAVGSSSGGSTTPDGGGTASAMG
jgi:ATP-dependent Clp protease ATP-binding subunit ClpC